MEIQFNHITQANWPAGRPFDHEANVINLSEFYSIEFEQCFRGYSIKYVVQGEETYVVNGREYRVGAGQYLLTNPHCRGNGRIASATPVVGLCINLRPAVIADVLATCRGVDPDLRPELATALEAAHFYEHRFTAGDTGLGRILQQLGPRVVQNLADDPANLYLLAEGYLAAYGQVVQQLAGIDAVRPATRHELLRRLERGREFIETCFLEPIAVADVARAAHLSTHRFFRLFRQVYRQSPHQFILEKRLEHGRALLASGQYSVTEAALQTGFADIFSFSKAYKKRYGLAPKFGTI